MIKMKKGLALVAAAIMLGCVPSWAKKNTYSISTEDGTNYVLTTGNVSMTINAGAGAKVMSLKYQDKEVIAQSRIPNQFGSTFWTSPQKDWNWPPVAEHDSRPYTVEQKAGSVVMTSQLSQRFPYRITKEFSANKKGIVITYTITNESDHQVSLAPWEITRVPSKGIVFCDAPVDEITPAGLLDFKSEFGAAWYTFDVERQNRKINADGKGWLAYAYDGLVLVKQFPDLNASQPAPEEAEIQVYVNQGDTYTELENQGEYTSLQPGQSVSWTVKWYLLPYEGDAVASAKLLKVAKKAIK